MSDLLPYTLLGLLGVLALLGLAGRRADTPDPEFFAGRLTERAVTGRVAGAWRAFQEFLAGQLELQERLALVNRPWEEEFFHWGPDGALHGHLAPPADGRRRSVTRGGWCPGARRAASACRS